MLQAPLHFEGDALRRSGGKSERAESSWIHGWRYESAYSSALTHQQISSLEEQFGSVSESDFGASVPSRPCALRSSRAKQSRSAPSQCRRPAVREAAVTVPPGLGALRETLCWRLRGADAQRHQQRRLWRRPLELEVARVGEDCDEVRVVCVHVRSCGARARAGLGACSESGGHGVAVAVLQGRALEAHPRRAAA